MKLGDETLFETRQDLIEGKKLGLLCHEASKDGRGVHILDKLLKGTKEKKWTLSAIFAPEHGINGQAQDMEPVPHAELANSKSQIPNSKQNHIPVYSLYGETFADLSPTPNMLKDFDLLIVDLQDIGSRYYTYANTMALCMRAARSLGKKVVVCDRPNPINGIDTEGPIVEQEFRSFVGMFPLPVRHGRTIGELARLFCEFDGIDSSFLSVVDLTGWNRELYWDQLNLPWTNPSPNMRSISAALLYPGICLLEGTNISEGRGTKTPFEIVGAPWIDRAFLADKLRSLRLPGIDFEPTIFTPTARKFAGERCEGVSFIITDRKIFRPYRTGLALIHTIAAMYPKYFAWRRDPYEFVSDIPAIDLLTGGGLFRKLVGKKKPLEEVLNLATNRPQM